MAIGTEILCHGDSVDEYNDAVKRFERDCFGNQEVPIVVEHTLHGGIYARHAIIPAGTVLTGALTSCDNICIVNGDITVTTDTGTRRICGIEVLPARAGYKRMGITHAETHWVMVAATNASTVKDAENSITSEPSALQSRRLAICDLSANPDVLDYSEFVREIGMDEMSIQRIVTNHEDVTITDRCLESCELRPSNIHGVGMFARERILAGECFAPARIDGRRCAAGRWVNHSKNPNCEFVSHASDVFAISLRDINQGEEITVNYRQTIRVALEVNKEY